MIQRQVTIVCPKTMADQSIRVSIDLLDGTSEDFKQLFELQREETTLILCKTSELPQVLQQVAAPFLT